MQPQLKRPREFVQDVKVCRMCVCLCFSVNHTLSDRQFTRVYVQVKSVKTSPRLAERSKALAVRVAAAQRSAAAAQAHAQAAAGEARRNPPARRIALPVRGGDDEESGGDGDGDGDREAFCHYVNRRPGPHWEGSTGAPDGGGWGPPVAPAGGGWAKDSPLLKREQAVLKREVKADAADAALKADEDEAAFKAGGDAWMDMLLDSGRVKEKLKDEHTLKQLCSYALALPGYEPHRLMGVLDEYKAECLDEIDGLASDIVRCALPVLSVVRRAFSLSHFAARVGRCGI